MSVHELSFIFTSVIDPYAALKYLFLSRYDKAFIWFCSIMIKFVIFQSILRLVLLTFVPFL
jgi:hypothetical protein